jgi:hypothetical protein
VSHDPGAPARTAAIADAAAVAAGLDWRPVPGLERCWDAVAHCAGFEVRAYVRPDLEPCEEYGGCGPGCDHVLCVVSAEVLHDGKAIARSGVGGTGLDDGKPGGCVSETAAAVIAEALEDARAELRHRAAACGAAPGAEAGLG